MITLIVWAFLWILSGGGSDVVDEFTNPQMAIFFLICVASDLNIILGRMKR